MALLESARLDGQRGFLLPLLRTMDCDGKAKARRGAGLVLVAEPDRIHSAAGLRTLAARFGVHLRICIHVDSLHSQHCDPLSQSRRARFMLELWFSWRDARTVLPPMRQ